MKHVNVIIILVCGLLFSCSSSRSTEMKQYYQKDSVSNRIILEQLSDSKSSLALLSDSTTWKAKITWYSEPDSTGKQYKQKEADIDYKGSKKSTEATFEDQKSLKSDSTSTDQDYKITTEVEDKKSSKPPELLVCFIIFLIILIIAKRWKS